MTILTDYVIDDEIAEDDGTFGCSNLHCTVRTPVGSAMYRVPDGMVRCNFNDDFIVLPQIMLICGECADVEYPA